MNATPGPVARLPLSDRDRGSRQRRVSLCEGSFAGGAARVLPRRRRERIRAQASDPGHLSRRRIRTRPGARRSLEVGACGGRWRRDAKDHSRAPAGRRRRRRLGMADRTRVAGEMVIFRSRREFIAGGDGDPRTRSSWFEEGDMSGVAHPPGLRLLARGAAGVFWRRRLKRLSSRRALGWSPVLLRWRKVIDARPGAASRAPGWTGLWTSQFPLQFPVRRSLG